MPSEASENADEPVWAKLGRATIPASRIVIVFFIVDFSFERLMPKVCFHQAFTLNIRMVLIISLTSLFTLTKF